MKSLSMEPDPDMRWIYDYTHLEYNTDRAKGLRERRSRAIQYAPEWMKRMAQVDDVLRRDTTQRSQD